MRHAPLTLLVTLASLGPSCRTPERAPEAVHVVHLAEADPFAEGFTSELLFAAGDLSAHRAVLAAPLAAHVHDHHAETVHVVAGRARMRIGDAWHELAPGAVVHLPPGTVHAVEPHGVTTALSVFVPPFDGTDRRFVEDAAAEGAPAEGGR